MALEPLVAEYCAIFGLSWKPATVRKHRDDSRRFTAWLTTTGPPCTTGSLDFLTLAAYVTDLRARPRVHGVWRGSPDPQIRWASMGRAEPGACGIESARTGRLATPVRGYERSGAGTRGSAESRSRRRPE